MRRIQVNAALPANQKLQEIAGKTIHVAFPCGVAFYDLDTDKNVLDYLTFLKLSTTENRFNQKPKHSLRHSLYPAVLVCSVASTCFALFHIRRTYLGILYSVACVTLQLSFICRPLFRAVRRFRCDPTVDQVPHEEIGRTELTHECENLSIPAKPIQPQVRDEFSPFRRRSGFFSLTTQAWPGDRALEPLPMLVHS